MKNSDFQKSDFLDILFKNRNKDYGAYPLRRGYKKRARQSVVIALAIVGVVFLASMIRPELPPIELPEPVFTDGGTINPIEPDVEFIKTGYVPSEPVLREDIILPPEIVDYEVEIPEEADEEVVVENAESVETSNNPSTSSAPSNNLSSGSGAVASSGNGIGPMNPLPIIPKDTAPAPEPVPDPEPDPEPKVIVETLADELPEFPGGFSALREFLVDNINYPRLERQRNKEGRVVIDFVVTAKGELRDIKVLRKSSLGFNNEAIRVMRKMPKWKPGVYKGKEASIRLSIPIEFVLEE